MYLSRRGTFEHKVTGMMYFLLFSKFNSFFFSQESNECNIIGTKYVMDNALVSKFDFIIALTKVITKTVVLPVCASSVS